MRRVLATTLALGIAVGLSLPTAAAVRRPRREPPSTFRLTAPGSPALLRGTVPVRWNWTGGSAMRRRFVGIVAVNRASSVLGFVEIAAPLWYGRSTWDTTTWEDGVYTVRAFVVGTSLGTTLEAVAIDNTAPEVRVTRPASGQVVVNDTVIASESPHTIAAGRVTLTAEASDALSGVASIRWYVDGEPAGEGAEVVHDFGANAAEHTVQAVATDLAGNAAEQTVHTGGTPTAPDPTPKQDPGASGAEEPAGSPATPPLPSLPPIVPPPLPAALSLEGDLPS